MKKKLLALVLVALQIVVLSALFATSASAANTEIPTGTPTIDGVKDAAYNNGVVLNVGELFTGAVKTGLFANGALDDFLAGCTIYLLHDDTNLYVFYNVVGAAMVEGPADPANGQNQALQSTGVFLISTYYDNQATWYLDHQKIFSGPYYDALYKDEDVISSVTTVKVLADEASGNYTVEYAIPLSVLTEDDTVKLKFGFTEGDGTGNYSYAQTPENVYTLAASGGTVTTPAATTEAPVATTPSATTATPSATTPAATTPAATTTNTNSGNNSNPSTGAALIAFAAVAVVSLGGITLAKKKR